MSYINRFFKISGMIISLALLTSPLIHAQSQSGFTYQAIARDAEGNPLKSKDLTVRIAISDAQSGGTVVWQEDHDVITSDFGLFNLIVGGSRAYGQTGKVEAFDQIDWTTTQYYLNVMVNLDGEFLDMGGSPIQTVPVAQYAKSVRNSDGKFAVQAKEVAGEGEALFEVRRSDGSVAFAVYEDMVWVYADDDNAKGIKGGFAVGGYNSSKAAPQEYMRITPDSIRMYINDEDTKGIKGGFAVGGYNSSKAPSDQYLYVTGNNPLDEDYSIALGVDARAAGAYSAAIGFQSQALGGSSFSAGRSSLAQGTNSIAIGNGSKSLGLDAASMGYQSEARGEKSIAIGSFYSYTFNYLPYFDNLLKGDSKADIIIWDPIFTPIFRPITFNRANIAEGKYSISFGNGNLSNDGGMSLGSNNDAIGFGAVALGVSNKARNTNAFAAGYGSESTGYYATAIGNNAFAKAYGSFVIGQYNLIAGDSSEWIDSDPLFVVGNGLNNSNRNNALTINKNGQTTIDGENVYSILNYRRSFTNIFTGLTTKYLYGKYTVVNRNDPDINYYYSGYYSSTGSEGQYQGLYADSRSGAAADISEYIYDTNSNTEPGDVLIVDPDKKESVILSQTKYQSSVIGVVSTDPHLTMGIDLVIDEETGSSLPGVSATRLALTGRVPCKVTDENGPIEPGDLLTTSSTPGHAMKWTPLDVNEAQDFDELKQMLSENEMRRHAVIGKALEAHNGGSGKIMVLISLQ